ncbi:GTP-binding protein HflX [Thermococcus sp. P6]|uniref:GTPase HflX n=1 Tax=Thermococcus sp. P6 TaxID=122420 RepID=UPI000B59F918|nr:GTPase HflX [Thermococcus sp. P6]ASJ10520.1 GTP-binding protein HflX [Thermococcus sp. P6]
MKVIGVIRHSPRRRVNREEFEELLTSAGYEVLEIVEQVREESPRYNIGRGKLEEIKRLVEELKPDKVVFANRLTPSQAYNLWKELKVEVIDRWQLVLEIFERRAHSKEAKLQVELAGLHYEVPLVKEAIRRVKLGDRAGFKGMGDYQTRQYLKHIRYRINRIRKELEKVRRDREVRRKRREKLGFILVALAGYTNAGKSTLLNALAGEEKEAKDAMFTTLDTTTRRFELGNKRILVTDTVGFIDGLPPFIVEAFHSTLEEIVEADVILLVVDVSEPWREVRRKLLASLNVLRELKTLDRPMVVVLNKTDLTTPEDVMDKAEKIRELLEERDVGAFDVVAISAKLKRMEELYRSLEGIVPKLPKYAPFEITAMDPEEVPRLMALINSIGDVMEVEYREKTRIRARIQTGMIKELAKLNVEIRRLNHPHQSEEPEDDEGDEDGR